MIFDEDSFGARLLLGLSLITLSLLLAHIRSKRKMPHECPRCGCTLIPIPGIKERICYNCGYNERMMKK